MNPAALGAGIGGAASLGLGAAQMAMTKRAQMRAQQYSVHNYKHRYQWMMEDLRAANLNPLLAVTGGGSPGSSPVGPGAGSFSSVDPAAGAAKGVASALGNAQKKQIEASTGKDVEMTQTERNRQQQILAGKQLIEAQTMGQNITNAGASLDNVMKAFDSGQWLGTRRGRTQRERHLFSERLGLVGKNSIDALYMLGLINPSGTDAQPSNAKDTAKKYPKNSRHHNYEGKTPPDLRVPKPIRRLNLR